MTYATQADLVARFGAQEIAQLTDPQGLIINDAVVAAALADADAIVDGHLQGRYTLPLPTPYPRLIVNLACDQARAILYGDRITEPVRQREQGGMALLGRIARGDVALTVATGTGEQPPQSKRVMSGQSTSAYDWTKFGGVC